MRGLAAALLLVVALPACRAPAPPASPAGSSREPTVAEEPVEVAGDGGTLRYAIEEPETIVPVDAVGRHSLAVVDALFDSLTAWGPDLEVRSAAAVRWSTPDGGRTWMFRLRPRATFHDEDATPVTAADFVFAWELAIRLDQAGYHLREVEGYEALRDGETDRLSGVQAVDDRTLSVRLRSPNVEFPSVVAHPSLGPVPAALWKEDEDAFRAQPVGNGPFEASEAWARNQFVRVTPFEGWRNRVSRPSVAEVVFQIMDPDTAYLAFQQGRLDFVELPPGALTDAESRYEVSPDGYTGPGVLRGDVPMLYYLGFDLRRPPFDDVEVRRALSMAVDRSQLAADMHGGNVTLARSIAPASLPGGRRGLCRTCRHDPDHAERVFAERGITSLVLWFNRGGGHEQVARRLRADLRRVGVGLELRSMEFADYLRALGDGEAGLFRFGWTVDYPTLDNALRPILHSASSGGGEMAHNYGGYAAEDVDDLLDTARTVLDAEDRRARYRKAADLALNRDQAIVPLFRYRHAAVASERVAGLFYSPMGMVDLVEVTVSDRAEG